MKPLFDASSSRLVAFDLHKHYVVVAAVNRDQEVVLKPRRLAIGELTAWAKANLLPTDQVVIEATGNAWTVYDLLAPLVQRCVVADARQVIAYRIAADRQASDFDGLTLADVGHAFCILSPEPGGSPRTSGQLGTADCLFLLNGGCEGS